MKRIADPSEIAAAIVYLVADATFSTGVTLSADGCQSVA
jgi:NAD(P)-dependent dehydrogenase (short-subunit alcohol dehydrogenase family)